MSSTLALRLIRRLLVSAVVALALAACSSPSDGPANQSATTEPAQTTIDPVIDELRAKIEALEAKLAATKPTTPCAMCGKKPSAPTTTGAPKPAVKLVSVRRFFSGDTKFDEHECREIFEHSDGTTFESPRWWAITAIDRYGFKDIRC